MHWSWAELAAAAALMCYLLGPRRTAAVFFVLETAVVFGLSAWTSAGSGRPAPTGMHSPLDAAPTWLALLATSAAGGALGWWLRQRLPPGQGATAPRVTPEP
jgi:hypothetical protein